MTEELLKEILEVLKSIDGKLEKQGLKLRLHLNEIHKKLDKGLLGA